MKFYNYLLCNDGATVVEYVLIAAGIALGVLAAVFAFGDDLGFLFDDLATATNN